MNRVYFDKDNLALHQHDDMSDITDMVVAKLLDTQYITIRQMWEIEEVVNSICETNQIIKIVNVTVCT